jgi:uncharacterized protein
MTLFPHSCRRAPRHAWLWAGLVAAVCGVGSIALTAETVVRTWTVGQVPQRTLSEQELTDMMVGAGILCTRGVNTASLIQRVVDARREGQVFRMVALEDLPDDWLGFTSFTVGGGGAWQYVAERLERQGFTADPKTPTAAEVLSQHLGARFDAVFQAEAGGASASTLLTAARMGIPVIDGCPSGRCLPEVQMSPFFMSGISRAPLAAVTPYGDTILVSRAHDDFRVEDLTRGLAVASSGRVTVAANALRGDVLKRHLVPGFLTKSMRLGRAAREAATLGQDPVEAVVAAGEGFLLFRGVVRRSDSKADRGFGWTEANLEGIGPFAGSSYRIYNKNENLVAWRDGKLDAAAPDLIVALDPKTGWAMRGGAVIGSFVVGEELAVVGFPSHALWRTPKAIGLVGPRYFGFEDEYVPIEDLHRARRPR